MKLSQAQLMDAVYHIQDIYDARKSGILPMISLGNNFSYYVKKNCNSYFKTNLNDYDLVLYNIYEKENSIDWYDIHSILRDFLNTLNMRIIIDYESFRSIMRTYNKSNEEIIDFFLIKDLIKIIE